jgi:hypothetical protein
MMCTQLRGYHLSLGFLVEIVIEKLSPNTAELIQAGSETFDTVVHKLINSMWSREE